MRIASRLVGRERLDRALKVGLVVLNPPLTAMMFVLAWRGEDTTPCLREASVSWKVTSPTNELRWPHSPKFSDGLSLDSLLRPLQLTGYRRAGIGFSPSPH